MGGSCLGAFAGDRPDPVSYNKALRHRMVVRLSSQSCSINGSNIMSLLARYIGRTVFLNTLLVLLVLVALSALFSFIRELDDVGKGDYSVKTALIYILLRMPGISYELFPSAVLLGSLLGLGAMASNSELTAMRSAGISIVQMAGAVSLIGLVLMGLVALLGEYVMPPSETQAQELRTAALSQRVSIRSRTGYCCLLYTSPSPRDRTRSRMPSSA